MTVQVTRLDNGLRIATDRVDAVQTVSLGAWVDVGTRHEAPDLNGIAHLLEHMAFKGTERRSARDIAEEIESVGGQLNAYTGRENTAYYAKVMHEDMPLALDVIADILQNSVFDPDELARERAVVLQEIGQALDTPDDIIFDHFQEVAYPEQALGRPVLGRAEIVAELARESLMGYMGHHYGANNMVVTASGKVQHEAFVDQVAGHFAGLPANSANPVEQAVYRGGDFRERRDLEQVHLVCGLEGVGYRHDDYYTIMVLSTLFGGGMSSRLFQEVREKRGLAYSIYSFVSAFSDSGLFGVYAGTGENDVAELLPVICESLKTLADGIPDDEVRRAKAQLRANMFMCQESTSARCEQLAQQLLAFDRPIPTEEILSRIEAVDSDGLARTAGQLARSQPCFSALGPISAVEDFGRFSARLN